SLSAIFTATAAALALSTAAYAASPAEPAANPTQKSSLSATADGKAATRGEHGFHKGGHHHKHMKQRMADAGLSVPGYGVVSKRFVDSLSLTEQQSRLVTDAQAAQKQLRTERGDGMKAAFQERREQIKQGKFDPREAMKQADARYEQLRTERRQID